ncbi:hypothetical protein RND81_07G117700 [Saponaria officinalis]|uniref:Uncharacterized protein n=1 Tax=Saponaria officinalis TaxID=3572 RepID=A0AAW1JRZ5_SAPOF
MEGVGARLGRSSSRYGTTTVFTGPVRKWSKSWVPISPSSSSSSSSANHNNSNHLSNPSSSSSSSSSTVSNLRLYKWTPLNKHSSSNNTVNGDFNSPNHNIKKINSRDSPTKDDDDDAAPLEPPRRKFKFVPIAVLEEQKKENERNSDDEVKPIDVDEDIANGNNKKPDINDVPMDENEDDYEENQMAPARQDLNELDLSLGLTSHEEDQDSDS